MTPAEYRSRYLEGLALAAPTRGEPDEAQLQALLAEPQRLYGPDLPGEPLLLARRQALLAVLRNTLPDPVDEMDLPGLAAWLQDARQAGVRLDELEVHLGHVERHEEQLDRERLRLLGEVEKLQHHLGHVERHEQQLDQERLRLQRELGRLEQDCAQLRAGAEQDHRQIAELEAVRDSTSYHLGRTLLAPLALLRRLGRRLGRKP